MSKGNNMYPGTQGIEACGDRGDVSLFDEARTAGRGHLVGSPVLLGQGGCHNKALLTIST